MILVYSKMFFWGFPGGSGGLGLTPGLERSPGEGNGYPPQYSWVENQAHGQRNLAGYSPWVSQRVGYNWTTNTHTQNVFLYMPFKYYCFLSENKIIMWMFSTVKKNPNSVNIFLCHCFWWPFLLISGVLWRYKVHKNTPACVTWHPWVPLFAFSSRTETVSLLVVKHSCGLKEMQGELPARELLL